ncbi:LiaI-LiaF-like domain-containing protein [Cellulomonas sp. NPDC057328]|uniref:LiaI-LiaF-like domain-containing protein n=1 Tax=Cellulomonas sp. NPDC057328 TaxID=3346101 RepID=UPI00363B6B21
MQRRPPGQVLLGLLVVAVGVVLLLDRTEVLDVDPGALVATWWPLALIALGVVSALVVPRAWVGPAVVAAVGAVLLLVQLDVVEPDVWSALWPLVVVAVGLGILLRTGSSGGDADHVTSFAFWWGAEPRTRSQRFTGASLTAIMGGISLDLREADVVGTARIDVFVFWGGVDIRVPRTWRVRTSGLPLLGGWEDKTDPPSDPDAPLLDVRIVSLMGGAEVRHGKVKAAAEPAEPVA